MDNLYTNSIVQGAERSQTTVFNDGSAQWHVAFPPGEDETRGVALRDNLSLKEFFERPIYAVNYSWNPASGTPFYQLFNPWDIFFGNSRVVNRISNYNLLSCKLRVKIMISGNSFYYGRLLAHYVPLKDYENVSNFSSTAGTAGCIQASQGLSAFIDPTESQGCEFTLPFVWFNDTLLLPEDDLEGMGFMYIRQLQFLKHANGSTDPINISVFLWAEDVHVSVPTTNNPPSIISQFGCYDDTPVYTQGDEYGTSAISAMAATVAAAAGRLANVPYIGKYARATEMASGTMGGIAKLFGFSRPISLAETTNMKAAPIGQLAVTNITDMSTKMTVDAKQELSIDPSIVGIGAPDELSLTHIASKQSYLTQFPWTTARAAGNLLYEIRVTPSVYDFAGNFYNLPACCFASLPFTYWRGTMRYRFQIVASGFHKGRLAITWDPYAMNGTIQSNVVYTRVIDLADERDVIIDIPWGSHKHYLNTLGLTTTLGYTTTAHLAANPVSTNGVVSVTVLNELSSPSSLVNNDISINVFVSMCDDCEFALPNDRFEGLSYAYAPGVVTQAGEYEDTGNEPNPTTASETLESCLPKADASNMVYFGERITSFRQLLKRYTYLGTMLSFSTLAGEAQYEVPDFPAARGYYISGMDQDGVNKVNHVNLTYITYLAPAFIASRGGIRRKYLHNSTAVSPTGYMAVSRVDTGLPAAAPKRDVYTDDTTSSLLFAKKRIRSQINNGLSGTVITSLAQQPVIEVELPYQKNERFDSARWPSGLSSRGAQYSLRHMVTVRQAAGNNFLDMWVAGAEDFTLVGFQGAPPIAAMPFI